MKNYLLKILFALQFSICFQFSIAQTNLVPNPSFENYTACPTALGDYEAVNWWPSSQTPDYFNVCANTYTNGCSGVPYNACGYQHAFQGNAYCGLYAMDYTGSTSTTNYREYISAKLTSTLTVGVKYFFSMQISCGTPYDTAFILNCTQGNNGATNKIGALFTTNKYDANHNLSIRNYAHFYTQTIITDSSNWTQVKGSFIADSTYQYINLGNFFDDNHTDTLYLWHGSPSGNPKACLAYYYIDEIILSTDSTLLGIEKNRSRENFIIYPNPIVDNQFLVKSTGNIQSIYI